MKALALGDYVLVNYQDRPVHAKITGFKNGALIANVSPYGGDIPLFLDDGTSHEKDAHACYYTADEETITALPQERFAPQAPTSRPVRTENHDA